MENLQNTLPLLGLILAMVSFITAIYSNTLDEGNLKLILTGVYIVSIVLIIITFSILQFCYDK